MRDRSSMDRCRQHRKSDALIRSVFAIDRARETSNALQTRERLASLHRVSYLIMIACCNVCMNAYACAHARAAASKTSTLLRARERNFEATSSRVQLQL
jgi:hypothetical protein